MLEFSTTLKIYITTPYLQADFNKELNWNNIIPQQHQIKTEKGTYYGSTYLIVPMLPLKLAINAYKFLVNIFPNHTYSISFSNATTLKLAIAPYEISPA